MNYMSTFFRIGKCSRQLFPEILSGNFSVKAAPEQALSADKDRTVFERQDPTSALPSWTGAPMTTSRTRRQKKVRSWWSLTTAPQVRPEPSRMPQAKRNQFLDGNGKDCCSGNEHAIQKRLK